MNYWLLKSEADCYSIDDLKNDKKTAWTGIRNYQARNFLRTMEVGDLALFYHSSPPAGEQAGVVGIAKIVKKAEPDTTALDTKDDHYDPKASKENPIWFAPVVAFQEKFSGIVSLPEIKVRPELAGIAVAQQGSRLSVMPISQKHFEIIKKLGGSTSK